MVHGATATGADRAQETLISRRYASNISPGDSAFTGSFIAHVPWYEAPEGWTPENHPDSQSKSYVELVKAGDDTRKMRIWASGFHQCSAKAALGVSRAP